MSEIVVFSTLSAREALIELVPEFEHASGQKVDISYSGGPGIADRIRNGTTGDLFVGPDEFSGPLITEGKLLGHTRTVFACSSIGMCVRAGGLKPDISSPESLKNALLSARAVSYSKGSSGIYFARALERLGIADAIAAKLVPPNPDELVGAVVARGAADIGAQQFSELLPVSGIEILGPLPAELQQTIVYAATGFPQSKQPEVAQTFVKFLRSDAARTVLRNKGLEPA